VPHGTRLGGISTELPLDEYILRSWKLNAELRRADVKEGVFRSPMWHFVRLCAAHPQLRGRPAMDAFQRVGKVKPKGLNAVFMWAEMFPDSDDPEIEFIATWDRVRVPAGDDILAMAVALAKERPLQPRNCISPGYGLYVSIAGRLQELRPGNYINLPVERLAKALGVKETTVSYYAQCAKKMGISA
jgi:hypothetical protein